MKRCLAGVLGLAMISGVAGAADGPTVVKNVIVCKETGRFAGWPANNGAWVWDDEIVVGFELGYHRNNPFGHAIDEGRPSERWFARSLDGGETWTLEPSTLPKGRPGDCPGGIDFTQPDFAMTLRMTSSKSGFSRFYWSADRCKTWNGPYRLPSYDCRGIAARTDYIVNGPHDCLACITASKKNGHEGRPFCIRTTDGGKTWDFVAWIGPEPKGYAIMPSTVRLSPTDLLTTIRCKENKRAWIDAYITRDDGKTWSFLNTPAPSTGSGNPPSMIRLRDGRLALTYGFRGKPYGIRARLSVDNGQTWRDEIILRDDAGCWDLGYPRTVQRADGKIVTMYYFNDAEDGERYIAATIWDPGSLETPTTTGDGLVRKMTLSDVHADGSRLLPACFGDRKIAHGGLYLFEPGETAHPEPRHVHDTEEVFIFLEGKGVLPIDGVDYPVQAGDIVIVHPGEDHHTRSSIEDPLVAAWYVMEK